MTQSRALLIIAIVLLLLPVLYVVSYLALVKPGSPYVEREGTYYGVTAKSYYRYQHRSCPVLFWPLEQIDRKVRPRAWEAKFTHQFFHVQPNP